MEDEDEDFRWPITVYLDAPRIVELTELANGGPLNELASAILADAIERKAKEKK